MTRPEFPAVIDNSIRSCFVSCPRKAELEYILHYKPRTLNVHLHAGGAYAHALEAARLAYYQHHLGADRALAIGLKALIEFYGDFECPADSAKSLERMLGALEYYAFEYPFATDAAKPAQITPERLGVEFSFAEPLDVLHPQTGEPLIYVGRLDEIVEFAGGLFGLDDKTTSSLGASWSRAWELRSQFTGYCVLPSTEVLTRDGWVSIALLRKGEEIVQYDTSGQASWAVPSQIHSPDYTGELITCNGKVSFTCTPEHRLAVFDTYGHKWKNYTAESLPKHSGALRLISAGVLSDGEEIEEAFIRLVVAAQADGSWRDGGIRFHFSKKRKAERLSWILEELGIECNWHETENWSVHLSKTARTVQDVVELLGPEKEFGKWLLGLGPNSLRVFIEEVQYWDGSTRDSRSWMYFTNSAVNADWVKTIAALTGHYSSYYTQTGYKTSNLAYRVNITDGCMHSPHLHTWGTVPYSGKVWCVTVPTSYFLIRDNGKISVTGNCWGAAQAGLHLQGFLVRGISILKTKYDTQQALTYRPAWMVDRWYRQVCRDLERMKACWREGYWDFNLDETCNAYGGCAYKKVCMAQDPAVWLKTEYERRRWDPIERKEIVIEEEL